MQRAVLVDYANYPFLLKAWLRMPKFGVAGSYIYNASFQSPNQSYAAVNYGNYGPTVIGLSLEDEFAKQSLIKRRRQEIAWAAMCCAELDRLDPSVVVSANTPLEVQRRIAAWCKQNKRAFVFWVQDIHGLAIRRILGKLIPIVGHVIGMRYQLLERALLRRADQVILISDRHREFARKVGVEAARTTVLENWANLEDLPSLPKDNDWSRQHGLNETFNVVYTGTLGFKHNPRLLARLASAVERFEQVRIVVISEGLGADLLKASTMLGEHPNLKVLPFQPFSELAQVLAAGDILTAILERDAASFSVPSKVLTYLCAGRPILMAVPPDNAAAELVARAEAGVSTDPEDEAAFCAAALDLISDGQKRARMGEKARHYAETHFQGDSRARQLKGIVESALSSRPI